MNDENKRFYELRRKIFRLISIELDEDDICLPDEGAMEIHHFFPDYFDYTYDTPADTACGVEIRLNCYTLGDRKKYRWRGRNFHEVLDKLEQSIEEWGRR